MHDSHQSIRRASPFLIYSIDKNKNALPCALLLLAFLFKLASYTVRKMVRNNIRFNDY